MRKDARSTRSSEENSTSGLRRSGALGSSGAGDEQAVAAEMAVVRGDRSAVPRDASGRRRKRTSKSTADVEDATRRPEAAGDVGVAVSDVRPDVPSPKISDQAVNRKPDRTEGHVLNGHVDVPALSTTTAPEKSPTSSKDRKKADADVFPRKTSDHEATTTFAANSGRDPGHVVNGYQEAPISVARDATTAVTGGPRSSAETDIDGEVKDNQEVSPLPVSVKQQTNIKPVNPDMAIFDVLNRQQTDKRQSRSEIQRSSEQNDQNHSSNVEAPTTVTNRYYCITTLASGVVGLQS